MKVCSNEEEREENMLRLIKIIIVYKFVNRLASQQNVPLLILSTVYLLIGSNIKPEEESQIQYEENGNEVCLEKYWRRVQMGCLRAQTSIERMSCSS